MFDLDILNCDAEYFREFEHFADLFKFHNTIEISQCLDAQKYPHVQKDMNSTIRMPIQGPLERAMASDAHLQLNAKPAKIYDLVVFMKQNINAFIKIYWKLTDDQSRDTLISLLCSEIFENDQILQEISDPVMLLSDHVQSLKIEDIGNIPLAIDTLETRFPDSKLYLRCLYRADRTIDLKIFLEDPRKAIWESADLQKCYSGFLAKLIEMNQTVGEALTLVQKYTKENDVVNTLNVLAMCDSFLHAMSQNIEHNYPYGMGQEDQLQ